MAVAPVQAQQAKPVAVAPMGNTEVFDFFYREAVRTSFRSEGIVKTSVLDTDETNRACSAADVAGKPLDKKRAKEIEAMNLKTIKWPADGKFVGDWKEGEALAQSGRGLTYSDDAKTPNGGNCYNCHQLDKKEISFGTIGPSLYNYGKLRGVTDVNVIIEYTWGKIWNSKAYNACSNMPRAGHMGIMTEAQVRHLVALLVDPKSAVNQ
jgi:sulfur-oxidizing protein SoxX